MGQHPRGSHRERNVESIACVPVRLADNAAAWTKVYVSAVMPINYLLALLLQDTASVALSNGTRVQV